VTWLVFSFILEICSRPLAVVLLFADIFPEHWLHHPLLQSVLAIMLTLVMLYGWAGSPAW